VFSACLSGTAPEPIDVEAKVGWQTGGIAAGSLDGFAKNGGSVFLINPCKERHFERPAEAYLCPTPGLKGRRHMHEKKGCSVAAKS